MVTELEWSDEEHATNIVKEFINRDLLPESATEEVTARLDSDEPLQALRKALDYT